jgi:glycine/D-amino acid oxidase-like deaminating enzyme
MRVMICGGGVISACTAYFLSRRGIDVTVVERTEVAAAASGKAGGFLALDWCAGTALDALARRSFAIHATLPGEITGDWGYQRMTTYSTRSSHTSALVYSTRIRFFVVVFADFFPAFFAIL